MAYHQGKSSKAMRFLRASGLRGHSNCQSHWGMEHEEPNRLPCGQRNLIKTKDPNSKLQETKLSLSLQREISIRTVSTTAAKGSWLPQIFKLCRKVNLSTMALGQCLRHWLPSLQAQMTVAPPFPQSTSLSIIFFFLSIKRTSSFAKEPLGNDWSSHANKPLAEFKCNLNYQLLKCSSISS